MLDAGARPRVRFGLVSRAGNSGQMGGPVLHLLGAQKNGFLVAVERLINERLYGSPELPARSSSFQQKVVGAFGEHALQAHWPLWSELRQQMAVLDQLGGKEKPTRVDIAASAVAQTPGKVGAVIRGREETTAQPLLFGPIKSSDRPFPAILNRHVACQGRNQGRQGKHAESR